MRTLRASALSVLASVAVTSAGCGSAPHVDACTTLMTKLVACDELDASKGPKAIAGCKLETASGGPCATAVEGIAPCYAQASCAQLQTGSVCVNETAAFTQSCAASDAQGLSVRLLGER